MSTSSQTTEQLLDAYDGAFLAEVDRLRGRIAELEKAVTSLQPDTGPVYGDRSQGYREGWNAAVKRLRTAEASEGRG